MIAGVHYTCLEPPCKFLLEVPQAPFLIAHRPPRTGFKKKAPSDGTETPQTPSLASQLSYLHRPRPFKNPHYTKNVNRRAKNLKAVIGQERERERAEREARRLERETNGSAVADALEEVPTYTSIEAPPSLIPHKHLCDITGLEAPYTDPATGLRYHDKSVYEIVKGLNVSIAKDYLSGSLMSFLLALSAINTILQRVGSIQSSNNHSRTISFSYIN
ncbi:hypothetical protein D9619_012298 [Psilocybe cf. subviscida]|uniref:Vps72/YL1 C-terminal domain-containing protein n=1 Tax=Psilocybe cf. subviscida TaxID=2480587 RepID=A0A8H5AR00_9AGAR|nr:hypothetical protein D9619_012298 [Psilocybe cf. subviscida]